MAYKYDVFLSYNRKYPHGKWVQEAFLPLFKSYFEEAANIAEAKIFIDTEEIKSGEAWNAKIRNALVHSRIMVSIFCPSYFNSEWCRKEFAVIDYRQRQAGFMSVKNPSGLIVPIKIFDGDNFPKYVNSELQISDFNDYSRIGIEKAETQRFVDFQDRLLDWVESVAIAHSRAPEWNDDWLKEEWITNSADTVEKLKGSKNNNAPVL